MLSQDLKVETYALNDIDEIDNDSNFIDFCRMMGNEILKQRKIKALNERNIQEVQRWKGKQGRR